MDIDELDCINCVDTININVQNIDIDETNFGIIVTTIINNTETEQYLENIQEKIIELQDQLIENEITQNINSYQASVEQPTTSSMQYIPLRDAPEFKNNRKKPLRPFEQWIQDKYPRKKR